MTTTSAAPCGSRQTSPPAAPPRLLDVLRQAATERGYSAETVQGFVDWTTRFILFNSKRHPRELTNRDIGRFLRHAAQTDQMLSARSRPPARRWIFCTARCCALIGANSLGSDRRDSWIKFGKSSG